MGNAWEEVQKLLLGNTIVSIEGKEGDDELKLNLSDGSSVLFWHRRDCCENVYLAEVIGDLNDLIGSPILQADEVTSCENPEETKVDLGYQESFTWTFYNFATIKGSVTLRWYGESNGYYSERVDVEINKAKG